MRGVIARAGRGGCPFSTGTGPQGWWLSMVSEDERGEEGNHIGAGVMLALCAGFPMG